jgi:hypothetical protein
MTRPDEYDPSMEYDRFVEELGHAVDLGDVTRDELVRALRDHSTGPVIRRVTDSEWTIISQERGYAEWVDALGFYADEEGEGRLVFSDGGGGFTWNPIRQRDEAKPRITGDIVIPEGVITRYTGGFSVATPNGERVWFCLWHEVMHVTESGDVAPGLGPLEIRIEEE